MSGEDSDITFESLRSGGQTQAGDEWQQAFLSLEQVPGSKLIFIA